MKILNLNQFNEKLQVTKPMSFDDLDDSLNDVPDLFDNLFLYWTDSNGIFDRSILNTLREKLPNEDCMLNILFDELHNKSKFNITDIPYFAAHLEEPSEYEKLSNNEVVLSHCVLAVCFNRELNDKQKEYFEKYGFNFDDPDANCTEFYQDDCYKGTEFYEIDYGIAEHFSYLKRKLFEVGDFQSYVDFNENEMKIDVHLIYVGDEDVIPVNSAAERKDMKKAIELAMKWFNEETSKELQLMIDRNK